MNSREVIKALLADGWYEVSQKGSHVTFKHPEKRELVTVTHPRRDIPTGLVKNIEAKSGLKLRK